MHRESVHLTVRSRCDNKGFNNSRNGNRQVPSHVRLENERPLKRRCGAGHRAETKKVTRNLPQREVSGGTGRCVSETQPGLIGASRYVEQDTMEGMRAEVTTAIAPSTPLTAVDRCDRCGAQAYLRVELAGGGELLFCAHHGRAHEAKLREVSSTFQDETDLLEVTPQTASDAER